MSCIHEWKATFSTYVFLRTLSHSSSLRNAEDLNFKTFKKVVSSKIACLFFPFKMVNFTKSEKEHFPLLYKNFFICKPSATRLRNISAGTALGTKV